MYEAVIFDFFGVIHDDPLKPWLLEVNKSKHAHIANITRQFDTGAISYDAFFVGLSQHSGQSVEAITTKFRGAKVNHEVIKMINNIIPSTKIALLSNAGSEELHPLLDKQQLHAQFNEIIISSEVGLAKPDDAIFLLTLDKLKTAPEKTLFIDDNLHNIKAAQRLGIHGLHFTDSKLLRSKLKEISKSSLRKG